MDQNNIIESGGFYFIHNFDSGNLGHVERVPTDHIVPSANHKTNAQETPDYEFNMWTRPDCAGTEFENGNRTWFYFGIQSPEPGLLVRLNLINLNKQGKMYNQGMAPVTRTLPGKPQWERIRDRPVHSLDDNTFTLTFKFRTPENSKATSFFAFTYPFSFAELQIALNSIDMKMLPLRPPHSEDDIYYHRECLIYSLEGRRVDLLTISSHHGILQTREERLKGLFPDNQERARKFHNKKVIFISARVHPGETPSSFVFNGFLNLLLTRADPIAVQLRKLYVFKMIPFLNPDGVARGHYRTDTRGVNLNRVYLNPSITLHPTVFASRSLIRYYHFGCEKEDTFDDSKSFASHSIGNISEASELIETKKKKGLSSEPAKRPVDKPNKPNKSSTTIKAPSSRAFKESKSAATTLPETESETKDIKLIEMPSQTSDLSSKTKQNSRDGSACLLNDSTLRSCLGSNVHLSTSEEFNLPGCNPLRPLRDTLKNSISLLMESTSPVGGDSSTSAKDPRASHVRIGWCRACREAIDRMEDTMPGIATMLPGYNEVIGPQIKSTYSQSIEEYRAMQRQQLDDYEKKVLENQALEQQRGKDEDVYFCTNCFKRYLLSDEEEIKSPDHKSCASIGLTCTESGDGKQVGNTGEATLPAAPPKEEKPKPQSQPAARLARKKNSPPANIRKQTAAQQAASLEPESGLYLYIDLHGHASKKGIFMYGNHFEDAESCVECMLLPRIMSLNNLHFHFSSCNFTERNMYLRDRRDGMSREGSGRVAVLKATGLVRSYTLECNYNTGRLVNVLPPPARDAPPAAPPAAPHAHQPPKYTPHIFQEGKYRGKNLEVFEELSPMKVGRSLGASILDLTGQHPNSRIPSSEHRNLTSVREWLRSRTKNMRPLLAMSRLRPKINSPNRAPLYQRPKPKEERKENTYVGAKSDVEHKKSPPLIALRSGHDITNKFPKKAEPMATRARYLADNEPKPKTLSTKRRNILAIRKPNSSKTQIGGVVKAKVSRRSIEEADSPRAMSANMSKRSFSRSLQSSSGRSRARRPLPSSSSEELLGGAWEEVAGGTALSAAKRRQFPHSEPAHLKKIRLKPSL